MAAFLELLCKRGPEFGLYVNLGKCEIFWPSGDQQFPELPEEVTRIACSADSGLHLLGSPAFGTPEFMASFPSTRVSKVLACQARLTDLDDPQVELHLLRSGLSLCKMVHLLRTTPPGSFKLNLDQFDHGLRDTLCKVLRSSVHDQAWRQANLLTRLRGLGLRQARTAHAAAFLGSCNKIRGLVRYLLPAKNRHLPDTGLAGLDAAVASRSAHRC